MLSRLFSNKSKEALSQPVDTQEVLFSLMFEQPKPSFFDSLRMRLRSFGLSLKRARNNNPFAAFTISSLLTIAVLTGAFIALSIFVPPVGAVAIGVLAAVAKLFGITAVASLSTPAAAALGATVIGVASMLLDGLMCGVFKGIAMCATAWRQRKLRAYDEIVELDSSGQPVGSLLDLPLAPTATRSSFDPNPFISWAQEPAPMGALPTSGPTSMTLFGSGDTSSVGALPLYVRAGNGDATTFPPPSLDSF